MSTGLHVGIVMDGNGRWAEARGLPRSAGHRQGADALRRTVEAAADLGVGTLTAFAFSSDNWKRPAEEVGGIFALLSTYLRRESATMHQAGVRFSAIGRRDRLPRPVCEWIEAAEKGTADGARLHLRLALDYSARDAIVWAAMGAAVDGPITRDRIAARVGSGCGRPADSNDVDLLIRTGGEQRLSDFLLWECAYAELWFTRTLWPDFGRADLEQALEDFHGRERRFGGVAVAGR
ncbi:MAG TPA: di-trans,poly-cis-decaprenylcistransferase [Vicinamibacterales bacterium]